MRVVVRDGARLEDLTGVVSFSWVLLGAGRRRVGHQRVRLRRTEVLLSVRLESLVQLLVGKCLLFTLIVAWGHREQLGLHRKTGFLSTGT